MTENILAGGPCDQCTNHTWHRFTTAPPWDDWDDEFDDEDEIDEDPPPERVWRCWSCIPFPVAADLYFLGATHRSRMMAGDALMMRRHYLAEGAPVLEGHHDATIDMDRDMIESTNWGSAAREFMPGRTTITLTTSGPGSVPEMLPSPGEPTEVLRVNMRDRSFVLFDLSAVDCILSLNDGWRMVTRAQSMEVDL